MPSFSVLQLIQGDQPFSVLTSEPWGWMQVYIKPVCRVQRKSSLKPPFQVYHLKTRYMMLRVKALVRNHHFFTYLNRVSRILTLRYLKSQDTYMQWPLICCKTKKSTSLVPKVDSSSNTSPTSKRFEKIGRETALLFFLANVAKVWSKSKVRKNVTPGDIEIPFYDAPFWHHGTSPALEVNLSTISWANVHSPWI